jgi:ribosomal protein S27AE
MSREKLKRASTSSPRCTRCSGPGLATSERQRLRFPRLRCAACGYSWEASDSDYAQAKAADQADAQLRHVERLDERRARA